MVRRNKLKNTVKRSAKCVREGYEREQLLIREPGKEADAVFVLLGGIIVVMLVGALLSLGLK